jgi:tRNA A37 threonylcarbamoyladenosine biosynthesis protein TsaE
MAQANTEAQLAITLDGEQQMVDFGVNLASAIDKIKSPLLILLNGDLGAGKTTINRPRRIRAYWVFRLSIRG